MRYVRAWRVGASRRAAGRCRVRRRARGGVGIEDARVEELEQKRGEGAQAIAEAHLGSMCANMSDALANLLQCMSATVSGTVGQGTDPVQPADSYDEAFETRFDDDDDEGNVASNAGGLESREINMSQVGMLFGSHLNPSRSMLAQPSTDCSSLVTDGVSTSALHSIPSVLASDLGGPFGIPLTRRPGDSPRQPDELLHSFELSSESIAAGNSFDIVENSFTSSGEAATPRDVDFVASNEANNGGNSLVSSVEAAAHGTASTPNWNPYETSPDVDLSAFDEVQNCANTAFDQALGGADTAEDQVQHGFELSTETGMEVERTHVTLQMRQMDYVYGTLISRM